MRTPRDLLNCGLGAHPKESSQPWRDRRRPGPAVHFQIRQSNRSGRGIRDPDSGDGGEGEVCGWHASRVPRGEWGPDREDHGSPNAPEFLGQTAGRQRRPQLPGLAGRDLSSRGAAASPTPRGPRPRGSLPPAAGSLRQARVRSPGPGPSGAAAPGSRQPGLLVPPSLPPSLPWPAGPGLPRLRPRSLSGPPTPAPPGPHRGRASGLPPGSARAPRPAPARGGRTATGAGWRGDYLPPLSRAPPLVLARRNAPRCAGGGRIQRPLRAL